MKVHHLNCGCMRPLGGSLFPSVFPEKIVCHCLLIETAHNLILVDSGLGVRDNENPKRLGATRALVGVQRAPELTAIAQIKKLGYSPKDLTDLVPTHLDFDHAGGIDDFPDARVHVSAAEYQACFGSTDFRLRQRYKTVRFSFDVKWQIYEESTEWMGFESAQPKGLPRELVCVKLPGHTPGHFGVALETSNGWMLHAGDAYYDHREIEKKPMPIGLSLFQKVVHDNYKVAMETQARISKLAGVKVFCAHDPQELSAQT